jgi:hypothetical protein
VTPATSSPPRPGEVVVMGKIRVHNSITSLI